MRLNLLHLDDALLGQSRFRAAASELGAREIDLSTIGPDIRLWATRESMQALRSQLAGALQDLERSGPLVTWMGSGDFHHVSGVLASMLAQARRDPITIVQFDNHPDWVASQDATHCGSWVKQVIDDDLVERVVGLGMTSSDISWPEIKRAGLAHVASGRIVMFPLAPAQSFVWRDYGRGPGHDQDGHRLIWKGIAATFNDDSAAIVLSSIKTPAIYVSIDKDVLDQGDADTNWDQGRMRLSDLLAWLKALAKSHQIIGLDVVGDRSSPRFGGPILSRFLKRSEILIDQPWRNSPGGAGAGINENTNLAILEVLRTMMC